MRYVQHIQQPDDSILSVKASVRQPSFFIAPFGKTLLIEWHLVLKVKIFE
jgi:hypothetical protein